MGGGRPAAAKKKPVTKKEWRIRGWRVRNLAAGAGVLVLFATGFYLAQVYADISAMIEQRRAALSSAIFSAPHVIRAGDDINHSLLLDRLTSLSYTAAAAAQTPGEYASSPSAIAIFLRGFHQGARQYPAEWVLVRLKGTQITAVNDQAGASTRDAMLEPEAIGRLFPGTPAERVEIQLANQKPYLVNGLLATEDQYFYYHPGINPIRIIEAAFVDLRAHRLASGASTLTQQLARTFMERRERSFKRKFRELAVAIVLEIRLKKAQILERYINDVAMGSYEGTPIQGMPQAARYFFNKDLGQVTPAEAATLIGMVQAPTMYDPRRHPEACTRRRNVVLGVMKSAGVIDDATYASAIATPLKISKPPGLRRAPYFTDYVISQVNKIPGFDGNLAGLKVFTTLDTEIQADTVDAITTNIEALEKNHSKLRRTANAAKLQTSAVVLDAGSGAIRALIGGRDYSQSQFNRAATALRQPGSAFKPIVYLAALDPERAPFSPPLTLASMLPDEPMSFNGWTPANYERTYEPQVTVVKALFESLNVPTAYVGSRLGPGLIVKTAHELGIRQELQAVLPISIGADETTLLELTSAYQVFASGGSQSPPYAIESVIDAKDHEIYHHEDADNRVINPAVAYLITGALKAVMKYGTGASAGRLGLDFPAAGKTGTTQDYKDAYFVGYTPEIVCGVWVGFDAPQSLGLTGAQAALPAWVQIMHDSAPADPQDFPEPSGIVMASIDPESGGLATPSCPKPVALPFLIGTAPTEYCPIHGGGIFTSGVAPNPIWGGSNPAAPFAQPAAAANRAASDVFSKVGGFFGSLFHR
ncbi:MAG: transglycosylase domain-containing protein [Candidatus Binatus sp.]|uniref:transglycosylase domain-containing protein n=1 Tax=Candidatus Binatus sp. TaxID=2811406 RepID=UPI00271FCBB4|nr:transglycosylase domain-containing protein [Candidatus Binatus sp.]MDO8431120.1 transglycosylase domain-containing protein [Candidatus Binatus sp.]